MQFKVLTFFIISLALLLTGCDSKKDKEETIKKVQKEFILQTQERVSLNIKKQENKIIIPQLDKKAILLNFWATWCPPCRAEIPHLNKLKKKFKGKFEIIGLNLGKKDGTLLSDEELNRFIEEYEIDYLVTNSQDNFKIANLIGPVKSIPTMFLIDTKGNIVQKYVGIVPEEMMELDISEALGE